eukprot:GHVN01031935.1.p1 GENE.GHVN01031935.1~~GHVN01031935.1.p1  ORF type:complete len:464 (+),score=88.02 GHVN01031935.1:27-1394(+)
MKDERYLYSLLGLDKGASQDEIRKAFRKTAKQQHPDKGGDKTKYANIQSAYKILSDPDSRKHYDETGRATKSAEESFLEFHASTLAKNDDTGGGDVDIFDRLARPGSDQPHTSGFEEWCRARDASENMINDDWIRSNVGVSKAAYSPVPHGVRHKIMGLKRAEKKMKVPGYGQRVIEQDDVQEFWSRLQPQLEWGEVLIQVLGATCGMSDTSVIIYGADPLWTYEMETKTGSSSHSASQEANQPSDYLGADGFGVVKHCGPGMKNLGEGDWVIPLRPDLGFWRDAIICKERDLMRISPDLFPIEYGPLIKDIYHGYHLLHHYASHLKPGDGVIINAPHTVVGQMMIQLCKLLGLRCIAVAEPTSHSSSTGAVDTKALDLVQQLMRLGASAVYFSNTGVRRKVIESKDAPPKMGFDGVGGEATGIIAHCLAKEGVLVAYRYSAGNQFNLPNELLYR